MLRIRLSGGLAGRGMGAWRVSARRGRSMLAATVSVAVMLAFAALAASALATSVALDAPDNGTAPLVAYDSVSQTTYVAWSDPVKPAVDLCILPSGASGCEGGAPALLEDSLFTGDEFAGPGGLVILPEGDVAVIGNTGEHGSIAWISPGDGSAFLTVGQGLQNGGEPISSVSLYYTFGNAVALSSTDVGLLDDYGDFFGDTSLTSASPTIAKPNSNQKTSPAEGEFPRKSLWTAGPEVAAEPAPAPAPVGTDIVVGVGDNFGGPNEVLPGCLNKEGTGYGVSVGKVDGTSNAAGTINAEGLPGYGVLACSAEAPVLAQGGADGIGLIEEEGDGIDGAGELITLDFRPFNATATGGAFGAPVELADVTHQSLDGVDGLDIADDSGTGIYASWLDEQGLVLDYSANGGATWEPPVVVPELASGVRSNPVIVGIGAGNVEIAYESNPGSGTQVFLESVNYAALAASLKPSSPPTADTLITAQTSGSTTGASITIGAGTVGETDRATLSGINAATATGTVIYGLFSNPTCTASSEVFSSGAVGVTAGLAASSAPVTTALAQGTYYWEAAYSGDAHNLASTSACGSEVLTVVPATLVESKGSSSGGSVTITISCTSTPCTVTITVTITEPSGKAAAARKKKGKRPKIITLATGKFTITTPGAHKLTLRLTKAGKQLFARDHGRLKAKVLVAEKTAGGLETTTRTVSFTPVKTKHKSKK
jgi:hypothetical protein